MSLLTTASEWKIESEQPKKRTPTIGLKLNKTKAFSKSPLNAEDFYPEEQPSTMPTEPVQIYHDNIEKVQLYNDERSKRVNDLINQMHINPDNDGEKLVNFNPNPRPSLMHGKGLNPSHTDATTSKPPSYEGFQNPSNPLQQPPPKINRNYSGISPMPNVGYLPGNAPSNTYTNYSTGFKETSNYKPPHYSQLLQGGGNHPNVMNDKLMEKINYMIHLLEEQQLEKTNNITEEFILYCLLGVFMIYTMDSFARAGKYVR
jgi:hypothetical protein